MTDYIEFRIVGRPLLANQERRQGHWGMRHHEVSWWRKATREAILEAGHAKVRWDRARFEIAPAFDGGTLPDTGAIFPTEKAVIDGIVDMDVIPDDTRFHVAGILSLPPSLTTWTGIAVRVVRFEHHPQHSPALCRCMETRHKAQARQQLARQRGRS